MSTPIDPVETTTKKKWRPVVIAGKEIKKRWIVLLALVLLFFLVPSSDDDTTEAGPAPVAAVETEKPTESAKPTVDAEAEAEKAAAEKRAADEAAREKAEKKAKEEAEKKAAEEEAERKAAEENLGETVTQRLLDANAVDSFQSLNPESPGFWIADIETLNSGTVRVNVQTPLMDDERDMFARWVFNMACSDTPELDTVVINDTSGIDSNHFIHRMVTVCS